MDVSKVIIGTWPLSGDYGAVELKDVQEVLELCYNNGFKNFDTAPSYGNSFMEFCLGKTFYKKSDVNIDTKIGNLPFEGKSFSVNNLKKSVEQSLKRLSIETINILYLHNPRNDVASYDDLIDLLDRLKDEGKIRYKGISLAKSFNYEQYVDLNAFDVIQDDINLLRLEPLYKAYSASTKLIARSPLASGLLGGHLTDTTVFEPDDQRSSWLNGDRLKYLLKRVDAIKENTNDTLFATSVKYLLQHHKIDNVIFGVKKVNHVQQLCDAIQESKLDDNTIQILEELYKNDFGLKNKDQYRY